MSENDDGDDDSGVIRLAERYLKTNPPAMLPSSPLDWKDGDIARCYYCRAGHGFRPSPKQLKAWQHDPIVERETVVKHSPAWAIFAGLGWGVALVEWVTR